MSWLVKTEPDEFSYDDLAARSTAVWDGVRNVEARNHLRRMGVGDRVLVYHTGAQRAVVGLARVAREAFPDPTANSPIWSAVELAACSPLPHPVSLRTLKTRSEFADCPLVRRPRLSVMPIESELFDEILRLAKGGTD